MYKIGNEDRKKILAASFPTWFSELDVKNLIADSEKAYICHYYPVVGKPLIGSDALKVLKEIENYTEIKQDVSIINGKTAFGGVAKGKVRKLMKGEDFSKFKEGEVLVAHMTRPEFVPTMKKASAVITDEGGITCHAAIVSRELKKPCIIGTKIATQVLNDGDEVEVDASNGVVRILKKAREEKMEKLSLQEWRARPRNVLAAFPAMYTMCYLTGDLGVKEYGAKLSGIYNILSEKDFVCVMNSKEDYDTIGNGLMEKFKKDQSYLDELIKWSKSKINILYDFLNKNLNEKILMTISNEKLAEKYQEYVKEYYSYHLKNTPSWWIGAAIAERELKEYLKSKGVKDIDTLMAIITDPLEYPSESFHEEISLLDIAIKLKKKGINEINLISELPKEIRLDLSKHTQEYFYIPFGYKTGVVWDDSYFFEKLKNILKEDSVSVKEMKLSTLKEKLEKRDNISKSLKLPMNMQNLLFSLRKLSCVQELKKTTQTKSHPMLQLIVKKEIAKRIGVDKKYIDYFSEKEIAESLMKGKSIVSEEELKKRDGFCILVVKDMEYSWFYDEKAKEFVEVNGLMQDSLEVKEIKGTVTSKGKVEGKVKICHVSTEIDKVKEGDILVTAMTTPDFVPAMRKAAAIITDEGGITCHAAIISRELNKPCIIGTKIATKVLKDGDLVEVDAIQGIVKIIKRA